MRSIKSLFRAFIPNLPIVSSEGHYMSEDQVQQQRITTAILVAFKRARIKLLPAEVRYSQHTEILVQQGKVEGEVKDLVRLIKAVKITLEDIMKNGDYSGEVRNSSDLIRSRVPTTVQRFVKKLFLELLC